MTRSELISRLAARFPVLLQRDSQFAATLILDAVTKALQEGRRVEIRGFGSFTVNHRPPKTGRNPGSGVPVSVPGKFVPHFKSGKRLLESIQRPPTEA